MTHYLHLGSADLLKLVYFEKERFVAAISGSSELLLFESNRIITSWDLEDGTFKWIQRSKCLSDLRKYVNQAEISDDMFVDALLLAGSHFLPSLPNLASSQRTKPKPAGAIEMIMNNGRSGISVVVNNQDDPRFQQSGYVDKYRRARLAVKHLPIITEDGKIEPRNEGVLPNDAHEFIGQRLPDEVHHYLSRGLINSRILSWRATSEIVEAAPVDGGDSSEYRDLVSKKLNPLRTTTINLLSASLHNWYQHKELTLKCWFQDTNGKPHTSTISMRNVPEARRVVETWNVKDATFRGVVSKHQPCGYLGSAILALQDADFVPKTVGKKDVNNVSVDQGFYKVASANESASFYSG